jgi:hypothetical protein
MNEFAVGTCARGGTNGKVTVGLVPSTIAYIEQNIRSSTIVAVRVCDLWLIQATICILIQVTIQHTGIVEKLNCSQIVKAALEPLQQVNRASI